MAAAAVSTPKESILSVRGRWALRVTALLLAAVAAYSRRHYLNADGICYLDLADAWAQGDWQAGLSTYWGPLYPALLGGVLDLFHPSPYWEFAFAKLAGFGLFVGALVAFEWLLQEVLLWRRAQAEVTAGLTDAAVILFAYPLFLLASLHLISLELATPDLCVALLVYLAAALMTRSRRLGIAPGRSALLGLVLGLAYLAKAALLPLGAVFLGVSSGAARSWKKLALHLAVAGAVWATIAGGYVAAMSAKAGRLTLGDASKLNYLWFVNGVEVFRWRTADPGLGAAVHPPRQLLTQPPVQEFAGPVAGTYPLWFDPAYWCAGLVGRWTFAEQSSALGTTLAALARILAVDCGSATAALLLLGLLARYSWRRSRWFAEEYPLLVPALAALGLYLLVHVQGRYLAPFLLLLALGWLAGLRFGVQPSAALTRRIDLLLLLVWVPVALMVAVFGVRAGLAVVRGEGAEAHPHWAVAEELARHGVGPGSQVAVLGDGFECGWARVGRLHIVAQLERKDVPSYLAADLRGRQAVHEAFRRAGAVAVVAPQAPDLGEGWRPVNGTDFRVLLLR